MSATKLHYFRTWDAIECAGATSPSSKQRYFLYGVSYISFLYCFEIVISGVQCIRLCVASGLACVKEGREGGDARSLFFFSILPGLFTLYVCAAR